MKVTNDNIKTLPISAREQGLLESILMDLEDINKIDPSLYIDWQDYHDEYSPERTDPCPDYYGYYRIGSCNKEDFIGIEMTIDDLDMVMCTLYNYIV